MDLDLEGKVALVTGGSRGIGRAISLALAERGCNVAICGRTRESLAETASDISGIGVHAWAFQADVSKPEDIEKLVKDTVKAAERLDIVINNAVTSTSARFDELTDDEFRYHIDVKLMAYIRVARLALPHLKRAGGGRIVNVGGMTARIVAPLRMTNGVVNAGVANFTKQFANYAAQFGVTVNCVHPGYTVTDRVMEIFEREAQEAGTDVDAVMEQRSQDIPMGRLIHPEDIAGAVMFFCSPNSEMITGQSIAVDGGSGQAVSY